MGSILDNNLNVLVVGGGIFGLTTAIVMAEKGYHVTVLEKTNDFMRGASLVNQNRVHMGYHYPRSTQTIVEALCSLDSFKSYYGDSILTNLEKYYAVAKENSLISAEDFAKVCAECNLPLKEAWPEEIYLNREQVAACWLVPETVFDYHSLRELVLGKIQNCPTIEFLRNASITDIQVGDPHKIWINQSRLLECNFIVNASYAGLTDLLNLLDVQQLEAQFELAIMPIMEVERAPSPRVGITVMDGPFCSLMPRGVYENQFILAHVTYTPIQRFMSTEAPVWDIIEGFPEQTLIEACAKFFPIVKNMRWIETLSTTKVVLPNRDHDDARPTQLIEHLPTIYSIFSGKLTTCVKAAYEVLDKMSERS